MRSALPSRSPTTRLSWAAATRRRAITHQNTAMVDVAVLENPTVTTTIERSADPAAARAALERLLEIRPDLAEPLLDDEQFARGAGRGHVRVAIARHRARRRSGAGRRAPRRDRSSRSGPRSGDLPGELGRGARRGRRPAAGAPAVEAARVPAHRGARPARDRRHSPSSLASSPRSPRPASTRALDIADPQVPFLVVGMGKLGGRELNYASDVDVLFVHDGDRRRRGRARRAGRC